MMTQFRMLHLTKDAEAAERSSKTASMTKDEMSVKTDMESESKMKEKPAEGTSEKSAALVVYRVEEDAAVKAMPEKLSTSTGREVGEEAKSLEDNHESGKLSNRRGGKGNVKPESKLKTVNSFENAKGWGDWRQRTPERAAETRAFKGGASIPSASQPRSGVDKNLQGAEASSKWD